MVRRRKRRGARAVLWFAEATRRRLFPPLRAAWARLAQQAVVPVTGRKAKGALLGALHPRTGHRIVRRWSRATGPGARAFLTELRRRYRGAPPIGLLLDQGPAPTAVPTRRLAAEWGINFVWLPRPWPEWNAMDQLWREWKRLVAANRPAASMEEVTRQAEDWVLGLRPQQALRKAGVRSPCFWLKHFLQSLWPPT
jgi:DDE superfamily endonuclease